MIRTFVQALIYSKLLDRKKITHLQEMIEGEILKNLEAGDLVPGAGGVRKMRVADPKRGKGKRGGIRVLYIDIPKRECIYLLYLYGKDEREDLSADGKRKIAALARLLKGE